MSLSTHVSGIKPADEKFKQMKAVWDACIAARVKIPEDVNKFFGGEDPDEHGVVVSSKELTDAIIPLSSQQFQTKGFIVDIRLLPPDVKLIKFENSW